MSAISTHRRQRMPAGYGQGVIVGQYRVTGVIGRGGMGAVYAAEHTLLGRPAAIKVLLSDLSQRQDIVLRFFNEARAAAAIRHPGIVEIYDVGWARDGAAYIVMEHLLGESLSRRSARGRLAWRDALSLARQIAGALAAAHGKGIVHRDLKPDNIFVVPDAEVPGGERIKLLDFGIAKLTDGSSVPVTKAGVVLGTPTYMAPEQCRAVVVDHRADLYALGCLIFKVCTGRPPFVGVAAGDVLTAHIYSSPPLLGSFVREISPQAESLVQRLLAKRPEDRPQRAEDVIQQIDAVLQAASGVAGAGPDLGNTGARPGSAGRPGSLTAAGFLTADGSGTGLPAASLGADTGADAAAEPTTEATRTERAATRAGPEPTRRGATVVPPRRGRRSMVWLGAAITAMSLVASISIASWGGPTLSVDPRPVASHAPDRTRSPPAGPAEPPTPSAPTASGSDPEGPVAPAAQAAQAGPVADRGAHARPVAPAARASSHGSSTASKSVRTRAATAEQIDVVIESTPAGAEVLRGDAVLGRTPFRSTLPRGAGTVSFVIKLGGYARRQLFVHPDKRISRRVALIPLIPVHEPPPAPSRDDSVNPF
jgi:hypothetical protein